MALTRFLLGVGCILCLGFALTHCAHRDRDAWQQPDRVVSSLRIAPGSHLADLGAGDGYFVFRLADATGKEGKVYAIDVDEKALGQLREAARARGFTQIETLRAEEHSPNLPAAGVDLLFLCNAYHHLSMRTEYFRKLRGSLRPGGRVAIVELDRVPWYYPLWGHETQSKTIKDEMTAAGYVLEDEQGFLAYQNFLVFSVK
jgi:arsenite methyltransferase